MPVQLGPELQEIDTQEVGFLSIAGDTKVKLLPTPWPADSLPPPTCSLLAVASSKGILAAAGPQGIVVASTDAVRKAYYSEATDDSNTRVLQPQLEINFPGRISHLAFSSDEDALVVAAQEGGLAGYSVANLMQGNTQPTLTLPLNGQSLRALIPNPTVPELFAVVTSNGELLMANLKAGQLVQGPAGPVMKNNVSCAAWSNKGKQIVAGLVDGTAFQMTPEGQEKAVVPRPPDLEGNQHVSSAVWLENDVFYMVYTPTVSPEDDRPSSSYYIITRQQRDNFTFNKLPEVCSPFGLERYPSYQFTVRLRNFEPDLKEALVVASTASTDVGLFTKSSKPLNDQGIVDVFTATTMSEDSRRAVLPMTEDMADTSPVGLALDLSSKEPVPSPIPGEDIATSGHPLPAILILNNEGMLSSWWFVYAQSIRTQTPYHALGGAAAAAAGQTNQQKQISSSAPMATTPQTPQPAFGQPAFGQPAFGKPAFGKPAFGQPAFGTPSPLGLNRPQPTFGSPSALGSSQTSTTAPSGPTFGTPSMMGQRAPAFGQTTPLGGTRTTFGQPSTLGGFGSPGGTSANNTGASPFAGGGFSAFASGGGFASLAAKSNATESPFAQSSATNPFADAGKPLFGSATADQTQKDASTTKLGLGSGGFVLGSTFKPDKTAGDTKDRPAEPAGNFSLGSAFGNLLNDTEMKTDKEEAARSPSTAEPATSEPASTFPKPSGIFGYSKSQEDTKPAEAATTPTSPFAQRPPFAALQTPSAPPSTPPSFISQPSLSDSTVKVETPSASESTTVQTAPEPPLPPEPTSKTSYAPGDTSASSTNSVEEAPLPPDFVKTKPKSIPEEAPLPPDSLKKTEQKAVKDEAPLPPDFLKTDKKPVEEEAPLPPDFLKTEQKPVKEEEAPLPDESEGEAAEFEDSGEEITPNENRVDDSFKSFTSLESSFGGPGDQSPTPGLFSKATIEGNKSGKTKQLFGEIPKSIFPPPKQMSPRSPSPVRAQRGKNRSRPEGIRSTSAPSVPGRALSERKAALHSSMLAKQVHLPDEESADEDVAPPERAEPVQLVEDEDEQLRADLQRPLSPAPTLDPFLPHQDYAGESFQPGISGQIERLYRDINSMIDTLGINSRSLSAFLLYQESQRESDYKRWLRVLESDKASDLRDEKILLSEIDKLPQGVEALEAALQKGQVYGIQEKLSKCHQLLSRDIATLRGQCAGMRRAIDAHVDAVAITSAPLSAEQSSLQQDLRQSFTAMQSKLADLERDITQLRAAIADASQPDSSSSRSARPTVEAVTSTINTMTNMAEKKSGDIDVLEAQMRKLGIDVSSSVMSPSPRRHADVSSPFQTPQGKQLSRVPLTPGSRDTVDAAVRTAYHTPESVGRFRSSLLGRSPMNGTPSWAVPSQEETSRWRAKARRRKELADHVRNALESRQVKVRELEG
ncbi:hypothetical protein VTO42DRAFT_7087 [Malbranchea cinnamomea]